MSILLKGLAKEVNKARDRANALGSINETGSIKQAEEYELAVEVLWNLEAKYKETNDAINIAIKNVEAALRLKWNEMKAKEAELNDRSSEYNGLTDLRSVNDRMGPSSDIKEYTAKAKRRAKIYPKNDAETDLDHILSIKRVGADEMNKPKKSETIQGNKRPTDDRGELPSISKILRKHQSRMNEIVEKLLEYAGARTTEDLPAPDLETTGFKYINNESMIKKERDHADEIMKEKSA